MNIYFDIETIPAQDESAIEIIWTEIDKQKQAIKAPSNYKDQEKIDAYILAEQKRLDDEFDIAYRKTSFDGGLGQICCIGFAIDDREPITLVGKVESEIIALFYELISRSYNANSDQRPVFIGHNVINFDLRFLFQRSVMCNVKPPIFIPFNAKPWDSNVYDTMTAWAGFGNRVSLDKLCKIFELEDDNNELDGSKVWDYYKEGRIVEIAEYCKQDVVQTRQAYKRMTFTT